MKWLGPWAICLLLPALPLDAQTPADTACRALDRPMDHAAMDHAAHQALMARCQHQTRGMSVGTESRASTLPAQTGQATWAAMAEVVRLLEQDAATDWSKVRLDLLHGHLLDMDAVMMRARVEAREIAGGLAIDVTGDASTRGAIERLITAHVGMLQGDPRYTSSARALPNGQHLRVRAKDGRPETERMIRGLGFYGLLVAGDHHARHHLAIARGDANAHAH